MQRPRKKSHKSFLSHSSSDSSDVIEPPQPQAPQQPPVTVHPPQPSTTIPVRIRFRPDRPISGGSTPHCGQCCVNHCQQHSEAHHGRSPHHRGHHHQRRHHSRKSSHSFESPTRAAFGSKSQQLLFGKLSTFKRKPIDDLIDKAARELQLSAIEHAALKMDLFRNFIRNHRTLREAAKGGGLLEAVGHPCVAQVLVRCIEDSESDTEDDNEPPPSMVRNVAGFKHGAIFLTCNEAKEGGDGLKRVCTFALDISKNSKCSRLRKEASQLLQQDDFTLIFNGKPVIPKETLQRMGISDGDTVDLFGLGQKPLMLNDNSSVSSGSNDDSRTSFMKLSQSASHEALKVPTMAALKRSCQMKKKRKSSSEAPFTFESLYDQKIIQNFTLKWIKKLEFTTLTPVQQKTLPIFLQESKDVVVEACTGSGKTLAYVIPMMERLVKKMNTEAEDFHDVGERCNILGLCLVPTKELASQIKKTLDDYLIFANEVLEGKELKSVLVSGSQTVKQSIAAVQREVSQSSTEKGIILACTPGRLSHLLSLDDWKVLTTFKHLEIVIFDEADRLFESGASFETQLAEILSAVPKQRRTGLFSATIPRAVDDLIKSGMRNPTYIRVAEEAALSNASPSIPGSLTNYLLVCPRYLKFAFLLTFMLAEMTESDKPRKRKVIVFFLTCATTRFFHKVIKRLFSSREDFRKSFVIEQLAGKMTSKARGTSYQRFSDASIGILMATDVAARGLDFQDVDWIIQFDAPQSSASFIHRIGRTARAGKTGQSLLLLSPPEESYVNYLENQKIELKTYSFSNGQLEHTKLWDVINLPDVDEMLAKGIEETPCNNSDDPIIDQEDFNYAWKLIRCCLLEDRETHEFAKAAFVSTVRAYKEHELSFLFPFKSLEVGELATSMALLRLPRVKEILGHRIEGFVQSSVDPSKIKFLDHEKERLFKEIQVKRQNEAQKKIYLENKPKVKKRGESVKAKARSRSDKRQAKRNAVIDEWNELAKEVFAIPPFNIAGPHVTRNPQAPLGPLNADQQKEIEATAAKLSGLSANPDKESLGWSFNRPGTQRDTHPPGSAASNGAARTLESFKTSGATAKATATQGSAYGLAFAHATFLGPGIWLAFSAQAPLMQRWFSALGGAFSAFFMALLALLPRASLSITFLISKIVAAGSGYFGFKLSNSFWPFLEIVSATVFIRLLQITQVSVVSSDNVDSISVSTISTATLFVFLIVFEHYNPQVTQAVVSSTLAAYIGISALSFLAFYSGFLTVSPLDALTIWTPVGFFKIEGVRHSVLIFLFLWLIVSSVGCYVQIVRVKQGRGGEYRAIWPKAF